jgi:hypothetical protein
MSDKPFKPYHEQVADRIHTLNKKLLEVVDELADITHGSLTMSLGTDEVGSRLTAAALTIDMLRNEIHQIADNVE